MGVCKRISAPPSVGVPLTVRAVAGNSVDACCAGYKTRKDLSANLPTFSGAQV